MHKRHGTHVILKAIAPAEEAAGADQLMYPSLQPRSSYFHLPELVWRSGSEMLKNWRNYKSSITHEDVRIATLLSAAYRLQSAKLPPAKLFWSAQLTSRSVALFGRPVARRVSQLAAAELAQFEDSQTRLDMHHDLFEPLLGAYQSLLMNRSDNEPVPEETYRGLQTQTRDYFLDVYSDVFKVFDKYDHLAMLGPSQVLAAFSSALAEMTEQDKTWRDWRVVSGNDAKLAVNVLKRQIVVGKNRAPIAIREIRGLFAHEVLVHATRAKNGAKRGRAFVVGLPNYVVAEEGLGVWVESAINGHISPKVKDRYIDVALALGGRMRRPLSRHELFAVAYSRAILRALMAGEEIRLNEIEGQVWEHINRIYRGSLGNHYIGVFTKDIAYYKGYMKMARYIQRQRTKKSLDEIFSYIMQGKFDPSSATDRQRLKQVKPLT